MAAVAALGGCGERNLFLGLPVGDGEQAAIIAVEDGDGLKAYASERGTGARIEQRLELGAAEASVTALLYSSPLAELGLESGPIVEEPSGRRLPSFDEGFRATISDGGAGDWVRIDTLDANLAALRIPDFSPCPSLVSRMAVDVEEEGWFGAELTRIDDGRALLLSARSSGLERRLYEVTANGGVTRVDVGLGGLRLEALATMHDDRLVLAGVTATHVQIWTGRLDSGFEMVAEQPLESAGGVPERIAIGRDDEPAGTIYALTRQSSVVRYEPGVPPEILVSPGRYGTDGALSPQGGGSVLFAPQDGSAVMRYAGGIVGREPTEIDQRLDDGSEEIWALHAGSSLALAGTSRGTVLRRGTDGWTVIGSTALEVTTRIMVPFGEGVLIGGGLGLVQQYEPEVGLCGEVLYGRGYVVTGIVPLGDVLIVAGYREITDVRFIPFVGLVDVS